jgi:membrane-associated phospholipid phosphatase
MRDILVAPEGSRKVAGLISHAFTFGFPLVLLVLHILYPLWYPNRDGLKVRRHAGEDLIISLTVISISLCFNSLAKLGAHRQRPSFHYNQQNLTEFSSKPQEEFLSFYSGDSTGGYTLAAVSSILSLYRDRPYTRLYWALGMISATIGALLRTVADCHWFTDITVGMVVGLTIGICFPLLLHRPSNKPLEASDTSTADDLEKGVDYKKLGNQT